MIEKKQKREVVNGSKVGNTNKMVMVALLSAIAFVLMLLHFPIKYLGFLELEVSDIPAILAGLVYGPVYGIVVELIKNILKTLMGSSTTYVGEIANFVINSAYVFTAVFLLKKMKGKYRYVISFSIATIILMIVGALTNYYFLVPVYAELYGGINNIVGVAKETIPAIKDLKSLVILGITPFNLVKGILISYTSFYVYKRIGSHITQ